MADECMCQRDYQELPDDELRELHGRCLDDIAYLEELYEETWRSDPGAAAHARRDEELARDELAELEHELWHRRDPLGRSTYA